MAQVTRYPEVIDHNKMEPPPEYYDLERQQHVEHSMLDLDDKIRSTLYELDSAKQEIKKVKSFNRTLVKKIEDATKDRDSLQQKIEALKVKLGLSNTNLNKCNDEKESMRTNLNDSQVLVARLEERLSAGSTELDRMRDPANPESNMSIRKHVINDKKEIKKLKVEAETERTNLDLDMDTVKYKDTEIKALEKELAKTKDMLSICEEERVEAVHDEEEERRLKEEMINGYKLLRADRRTYQQRLKDARVKLGVRMSGKNVNVRVMDDMKKQNKDLTKQLNQYERKLKEATVDLDILKNQHKMSKTAMSINKYTRRNQSSSGQTGSTSVAQSGKGPVQFAQKVKPEHGTLTSRSKMSDPGKSKTKGKKTGGDTDRSHNASLSQRERQATVTKQSSIGKGDTKPNVQFVPPPKAKLKQNAR